MKDIQQFINESIFNKTSILEGLSDFEKDLMEGPFIGATELAGDELPESRYNKLLQLVKDFLKDAKSLSYESSTYDEYWSDFDDMKKLDIKQNNDLEDEINKILPKKSKWQAADICSMTIIGNIMYVSSETKNGYGSDYFDMKITKEI